MSGRLPFSLALTAGSLALAFTAGAGIAYAQPNLDSAVNTSCSYPQVMAAANAQDPAAAAKFESSPMMQSVLRQFLAAPTEQRQRMAEAIVSNPANQASLGILQAVFDTCNNF
ncbi:hemophore-related protein [Mycobacterium sp. NPDC003449]